MSVSNATPTNEDNMKRALLVTAGVTLWLVWTLCQLTVAVGI